MERLEQRFPVPGWLHADRAVAGIFVTLFLANLLAAIARMAGIGLAWWEGALAAAVLAAALVARNAADLKAAGAFPPGDRSSPFRFTPLVFAIGALTGAVLLSVLSDYRYDRLCHYALANGILRGNLPVHDLAWPSRLLPYHYSFDLLAALIAKALRSAGWAMPTETALDLASGMSVACLLVSAALLLHAVAAAGGRRYPATSEIAAALLLLVSGGGMLHLGRAAGWDLSPWSRFEYDVFHPLLQYVGRRAAVPGQAVFLLLFSRLTLLMAGRLRLSRWMAAELVAFFALLALTAEELCVALLCLAGLGCLFRRARQGAAAFLLVISLAAPLIAFQGGLASGLLLNEPLSTGMGLFDLHAPRLPGTDLGRPGFREPLFWMALLVELPVTIPLLILFARSLPRWIGVPLGVTSAAFLLVPLCVTFGYADHDTHRLLFLPQLLSLVLVPALIAGRVQGERGRAAAYAALFLLTLPGPILYASSRLLRVGYGNAEIVAMETRMSRTDELTQPGRVWLASFTDYQPLHFNGVFSLSAPFGTYGPGFYCIGSWNHMAWLNEYLKNPSRYGATHGLLLDTDLDTLRSNGVAHQVIETLPGRAAPVHVVAFERKGALPPPSPGTVHPDFVRSLRLVARELVASGNYAEAEFHYREALALRPDLPDLYRDMAELCSRRGRVELAQQYAAEADRLDAGSAARSPSPTLPRESGEEL